MKKIKAEEYSKWDKNLYKELTPLEAFNKFLEYVDTPTKMHLMTFGDEKGLERYRVLRTQIETALKEYEGAKNHIKALNEERIENSLKLKALEIIKEKRVNVQALFYSSSCEDYNKHYTHYEDLTQEEYNLLKEVLL